MTVPVVVADQPLKVVEGGGQVGAVPFVDEQSSDDTQPITVHGRQVDPVDEFDRIFCFHGESV